MGINPAHVKMWTPDQVKSLTPIFVEAEGRVKRSFPQGWDAFTFTQDEFIKIVSITFEIREELIRHCDLGKVSAVAYAIIGLNREFFKGIPRLKAGGSKEIS